MTAPTTALTTSADALPDRLGVLPWPDEDEGAGHDPRSAYVETFWLPLLGPSTTLLMRRLADELDAAPDGFEIETVVLSRDIGLGPRLTRRSPFARTIERCTKFHLAKLDGPVLFVRRRVPRLSAKQAGRLSPRMCRLHEQWSIDAASDGAQRRSEMVRATHLARTLLALGEAPHDIERQLERWKFPPAIAWHAVQWAESGDLDQL